MSDYSLSNQYAANQQPQGLIGGGTPPPQDDKPWWRDETYASAISGSIKGIFDYMNLQEGYNQQKKMQKSSFDFQTRTTDDMVKRASTMPLLRRLTKPKGK